MCLASIENGNEKMKTIDEKINDAVYALNIDKNFLVKQVSEACDNVIKCLATSNEGETFEYKGMKFRIISFVIQDNRIYVEAEHPMIRGK